MVKNGVVGVECVGMDECMVEWVVESILLEIGVNEVVGEVGEWRDLGMYWEVRKLVVELDRFEWEVL